MGRSGCFLTAEVALLVAETELVSEAEKNEILMVIIVTNTLANYWGNLSKIYIPTCLWIHRRKNNDTTC